MRRRVKICLIIVLSLFVACAVPGRNGGGSYKSEAFLSLEKSPVVQPVVEGDPGLFFFRNRATRDEVVAFYTEETGERAITGAILEAAAENDIPLSLAFSLCRAESGYNPLAVNENGSSIDRGLFQLNSKSFPDLEEADFFSIDKNARYGMAYLRYCLNSGEDDIVALAIYNAGHQRVKTRGAPLSTLEYISRIVSYKTELDRKFSEKFRKTQPIGAEQNGRLAAKAVQASKKSIQ